MSSVQSLTNFKYAIDAEGIATLTIDVPNKSMNVLGPALEAELAQVLDAFTSDATAKGMLITSAKPSFVPGYDLGEFLQLFSPQQTTAEVYRNGISLSKLYRRLETCGKPVAVAINGLALGGGLELCLACHYRVLADHPKAVLGLPEVKVGLLPGAGGTQRMPRLIGIEKALPLLLEGRNVTAGEALKLGMVHQLAPLDQIVATARRWLLGTPVAQQPWDQKGFRLPGGANILLPNVAGAFIGATTLTAKLTQHNYPAPIAILSAVF